jgi:hypothetical protein
MTLPKITAARPLGSPGVVRSPAAAPGSFEDRYGLLVGFVAGMVIVGLCAWAMPQAARATHEPGLASRPGHSVSVPNAEWQHVLEDGSLDHEWVTEFGVTFCTHCEAPKPEAD